ncbi:hypothetical protein ABZV14_33200 [Streptosporangium canum]|uniref:hypothetical protein n=1 Tax=Streptosporangium canum TaxID=324952 RepID=UPI0033B6A792
MFTLVTVPTGVALARLQVLETNEPWLFATVAAVCTALTVLLLRTRSARTPLQALCRRFTP